MLRRDRSMVPSDQRKVLEEEEPFEMCPRIYELV
jgi:hypothetical protein